MKAPALHLTVFLAVAACAHQQLDAYLTKGTVPQQVSHAKMDSLREALKDHRWIDARRIYFDSSYTSDLADIVIYIDPAGRVHQDLTKGCAIVADRILHGETYVYALLFSDSSLRRDPAPAKVEPAATGAPREGARVVFTARNASGDSIRLTSEPPPAKAAPAPAPFIRVTRTSLDYQTDPLLTRLVNALLSKFFPGPGPTAPPATQADSSSRAPLLPVTSDSGETLYVALQRMRVPENTWSRITVEADTGWALPLGRERHVLTNFENTDRSTLAFGMGVLFTLNARTIKNDTLVGQQIRPGLYLLGHWYLRRPQLPIRPWAFGPMMGVRLNGSDLLSPSELILGVSLDRVGGLFGPRGDMGIAVGVSWLESQKARTGQVDHLPRISLGLTLPL